MGHAYGPNETAAVFRSWRWREDVQKVLFKDNKTGAIGPYFDPSNPHVLFARSITRRSAIPGPQSAAGPAAACKIQRRCATWKRLEGHGLPSGVLRTNCVSVSGADRIASTPSSRRKRAHLPERGAGENLQLLNPDHRFTQRACISITF